MRTRVPPMKIKEAIIRLRNKKWIAKDIGQTICLLKTNWNILKKKESTGVCLGSLPCCGMKHHPMSLKAHLELPPEELDGGEDSLSICKGLPWLPGPLQILSSSVLFYLLVMFQTVDLCKPIVSPTVCCWQYLFLLLSLILASLTVIGTITVIMSTNTNNRLQRQ